MQGLRNTCDALLLNSFILQPPLLLLVPDFLLISPLFSQQVLIAFKFYNLHIHLMSSSLYRFPYCICIIRLFHRLLLS